MLVGIHRRTSPDYVADELTMTDNGRRRLSLLLQRWLDEQNIKLAEQRSQSQERKEDLEMSDVTNDQIEAPAAKQKRLERREKVLLKLAGIVDGWKLEFELDATQPFPGGRSKGAGKNSDSVVMQKD
jgi:hypothetical protein